MPSVAAVGVLYAPHRNMRCGGSDFVVAAWAPIDLHRAGPRNRDHLVVVAVWALLDATEHQNNRNSSLSIPRIES